MKRQTAIYYRVSTDGQTLESQKHDVEKWCDENNVRVPKHLIFRDEGISGKTEKRPAYQKMMKAVREGKVDTVIVSRLDRFSRKSSTAIKRVLELENDLGCVFVVVNQKALSDPNNPMRNTMLAMLSDFAEIERKGINERCKSGILAAKKRANSDGIHFNKDKKCKIGAKRKIDAQMADMVIQMRNEGKSYRAIGSELGLAASTVQFVINPPKVSDDLAAQIREMHTAGKSYAEIRKQLKVTEVKIHAVLKAA